MPAHNPSLPLSVVPADFAAPIGEFCLAFQRIEDELDEICFETLSNDDYDFYANNQPLNKKLETSRTAIISSYQNEKDVLSELFEKIIEVKDFRNNLIHAHAVASLHPGHTILIRNRKRKDLGTFPLHIDEIGKCTDRVYLIIIAMENRRLGVSDWAEPLRHWTEPFKFFEAVER